MSSQSLYSVDDNNNYFIENNNNNNKKKKNNAFVESDHHSGSFSRIATDAAISPATAPSSNHSTNMKQQQQQQEKQSSPANQLSLFQKQVNNLLRNFVHTCGDIFPPICFKTNFSSSVIVATSTTNDGEKKNVTEDSSSASTTFHQASEEVILNNKFELAKGLIVNFPMTNEFFVTAQMFQRPEQKQKQQQKSTKSTTTSPRLNSAKAAPVDGAQEEKNEDDEDEDDEDDDDDEELDYEEEPFSSESEFILCKHAQFLVSWWRRAVGSYSIIFRENAFPTRSAFLQAVQHAISDFHAIYTQYIERRLRVTTVLPRVLRLGLALKMSPTEVEALVFILIHHCATKLPLGLDRDFTNTMHNIGYYCGMSSRELMFFAGPSRLHCKQGVVTIPERFSPPDEARVRMPPVVATALSGARLSQEETVKLEKTALCDMLIDDGDIPSGLAIERADSTFTRINPLTGLPSPSPTNHHHENNNNNNTKIETKTNNNNNKKSKKESGKRRQRDEEEENQDQDNDNTTTTRGGGRGRNNNSRGGRGRGGGGSSSSGRRGGRHHQEEEEDDEDFDEDEDFEVSGSDEDDDDDENNSEEEDDENNSDDEVKSVKTKRKPPLTLLPRQQQQQNKKPVLTSQVSSPTTFAPLGDGFGGIGEASKNNNNTTTTINGLPSNLEGVEPYLDDKSYMEDAFQALAALIKTRNAEGDMKDEDGYYYNPKTSAEAQLRELKGKERLTRARLNARLEATRRCGKGFLPKIEELGDKLNLTSFEKLILLLLVGNVVSHDILIAINGRFVMRDGAMQITVGYILFILCETLTQRIAGRRCFTKDSPLLKSSLISVNPPDGRNSFNADLVEFAVDIDRKIVDQMVGLETSPGELVQGSKLYAPKVSFSDVVLPADTKRVVLSAIQHYHLFAECTAQCGLRAGLSSNASALVFLFSGQTGTGKTLLANVVAAELKKKILLVNALSVKGASNPGDVIRFLFREAKLSGAVVFFDECETLFENRSQNPVVTSLLAEFELFDGVVILATNARPGTLEHAMNRRISTVIEFKNPDHRMRREIWQNHLPSKIPLDPKVNLEKIALDYELSGGLIKNAVLAALRCAVEREKSAMPKCLTAEDLERGARSQLRGLFHLSVSDSSGSNGNSDNRIVTPNRSLSDIVLDDENTSQMNNLIRKIKSRNVLFGQWGFDGSSASSISDQNHNQDNTNNNIGCGGNGEVIEPLIILVKGADGKSLFAEIVAHECGLNMRIDNLSAMILKGKDIVTEMQLLFAEARNVGAAVVLDGAEEMFGSGDTAMQTAMLLQYHANQFRRPIFLLAKSNNSGNGRREYNLDPNHCSLRFSDVFTFTLPTQPLRERMWRSFIPSRVPLAKDINWKKLSEWTLSAKAIRAICFNACSMAAMMTTTTTTTATDGKNENSSDDDMMKLTNALLVKAGQEYLDAEAKRRPVSSMFM